MGKDIRGYFHVHADLSCFKYREAVHSYQARLKVASHQKFWTLTSILVLRALILDAIADIALTFFYMM
jgi:hypothetical protein